MEDSLTCDATHLVARETTSAKYRSALELGIPVLKSSWLREIRRAYVEDEEVDQDEVSHATLCVYCDRLADFVTPTLKMLREHALTPLEGIHIGLAGYSEGEWRVQGAAPNMQLTSSRPRRRERASPSARSHRGCWSAHD